METQVTSSPCSQTIALGSAVAGGVALFSVRPISNSAASGYEIWTSDGTSAGTRIAFELAPGNAHLSPRLLGALGDRIYFFFVRDPLLPAPGLALSAGLQVIVASD